MKLSLSAVAALAVAACTPSSVTPSPDASDAALESSPLDAAPADACVQACAAMAAAGCVQPPTCASVLTNVQAKRLKQNPANGNLPLTCADLTGVHSAADVQARGWSCGP